jgi:zinc/manganese transport system permease protein
MSAGLAEAWFLVPLAALACALLALAPLGEQVLARGVVFIDLAVAQAAAAAAMTLGAIVDHPGAPLAQAAAIGGALACALAVAYLARRWPAQREALIGLIYVLGAALALLAARADPHGRERIAELLAADLLWAQWPQVALLAALALLAQSLRRALARDAVFYSLFALAAALSVQALGLFVVFALLIAPALWRHAGASHACALGGALAAGGAGLAASWLLDAPSGPCVAFALASFGVLTATYPGSRGPRTLSRSLLNRDR